MSLARAPDLSERWSPVRLWALTCVSLAYGFLLADQGLFVAPLEAERLFPGEASLGLGSLAVCCGLAQLAGPVAGHWSDQYRSRLGRRRPCLAMGFLAAVILTGSLWMFSQMHCRALFLLNFLLQQIAWNVMLTAQAGLVPDLVPTEQHGAAGGATAANTLAGALAALLGIRFVDGLELSTHYAVTVLLALVTCIIVYFTADERPSLHPVNGTVRSVEVRDLCLSRFKAYYQLDVRKHPEFAKLLLSKTMYGASVMVKGFLLFFVQDTFKLRNLPQEQAVVSNSAIGAETTAALSAVVSMMMLDAASTNLRGCSSSAACSRLCPRASTAAECDDEATSPLSLGFLRSRRAGCSGAAWMGLLWFGPLLVGLGVTHQLQELEVGSPKALETAHSWVPYMVAGTMVWGLGQGIYLAADQALTYALLPDAEEASRLLGLTSVCSCVGAVTGGSSTGALLYLFGGSAARASGQSVGPEPGYEFPGYAAVFLLATVFSWMCGALVSSIRARHEGKRTTVV